jgi:hypothetical protein
MNTTEQQSAARRDKTLSARQYRVMGWFLIVLAVVLATVVVADFWKRLGSAAPILTLACAMDVVAGGILIYLGNKKEKLERNG